MLHYIPYRIILLRDTKFWLHIALAFCWLCICDYFKFSVYVNCHFGLFAFFIFFFFASVVIVVLCNCLVQHSSKIHRTISRQMSNCSKFLILLFYDYVGKCFVFVQHDQKVQYQKLKCFKGRINEQINYTIERQSSSHSD